jgi:hypothetical protein
MPQPNKNKGVLTRRDALKTLAAVTGAVTLAGLPGQWETPLVQVGALPAHAQCSLIPGTALVLLVNRAGGTLTVELRQGQNLLRSAVVDEGESQCWSEIQPGTYDLAFSIQGGPCDGASGEAPFTSEANESYQIEVLCQSPTGLSISTN